MCSLFVVFYMRVCVYLLCIRCFASSRFFSGSSHVHSCSGWRMIWEWLCSVCLAFCSPYTPRMEMYRSPRIDMNLVKQLWKLPFFHACAEQSWAEPFCMCVCASVCVCMLAYVKDDVSELFFPQIYRVYLTCISVSFAVHHYIRSAICSSSTHFCLGSR